MRLPSDLVDDVKLAVTEACTNVVRHAYAGGDGPLDVRVEPAEECLTVIVSDQGRGIRPCPESDGAGLGLPLIAALPTSSTSRRTRPKAAGSACRSGPWVTLEPA